jgi:hypothetical protein
MSLTSARSTLSSTLASRNSQISTSTSGFKALQTSKNNIQNNPSTFTTSDYSTYTTAESSHKSNMVTMADLLKETNTNIAAVYALL